MWVDSSQDEQQYNKANAQPIGGNVSIGAGGGNAGGTSGALGGQSTSGTAASPSNPSTSNPQQTTGPTQQFATIQDYLGNSANQQAGNALAGNLNTSLQNTANTEQGTIQSAVNQTQSDINAGSVQANPSLISQAVSNPTSITGNANNLNNFLQQWNAAYTGPSSFETSTNYAPAVTAANEATQTGAEVADTGGRQTLLNSTYGVTGQGNQGLDQALIQQSPQFSNLLQTGQTFNNIPTYLANQAATLDTAAQNAAASTAATKAAAQQAFSNALPNFQNQINAEVQQAQAAAAPLAQKYQSDFAAGNPQAVASDLTAMGATPAQVQSITQYLTGLSQDYNQTPNLSNYYSYNPATAITSANTATPQDYANAAALQQLTGVDYTSVLNPANASQAGTAPAATTGVNTQNLQTYLQEQLKTQDTNLLNALGTPSANGKVTVIPGGNYMESVANALGQPNVWEPINQGNLQAGTQEGQALVDMFTRQGIAPTDPRVQALFNQSQQAVQGILAAGRNFQDPAYQGLLAFTQILNNFVAHSAKGSVVKNKR